MRKSAFSAAAFSSAPLAAAALLAGSLLLALPRPAFAEIVISIDKSSQSMTVTVDGTPRYIWPVSTGKPGYDTPNGRYRPNRMDADHLSQEWDNAPMPHTIFFDLRGHAIHGFLDTRRIGSAASHGCVRLAPENATVLYQLVEAEGMRDTTVIVSGSTPTRSQPEIARRGDPAAQAALPQAPDGQDPAAGQPLSLLGGLFGQPQPAPAEPQQHSSNSQRSGLFGGPQPPQPPPVYGQQATYGQVPPPSAYYGQQPYYNAAPGYQPRPVYRPY